MPPIDMPSIDTPPLTPPKSHSPHSSDTRSADLPTIDLPTINLSVLTLSPECLSALELKFILKYRCLIFAKERQDAQGEGCLHIALESTEAPIELISSHILGLYPAMKQHFFLAKSTQKSGFDMQVEQIARFQSFCALTKSLLAQHTTQSKDFKSDSAAAELLDFILCECVKEGASDIHFESGASPRIRIRADGVLREIFGLELSVFEALSMRLKLECELDMTHTKHSQDGRFMREIEGASYDFRLSLLPSFGGGESLVIRILSQNSWQISLHALGFEGAHLGEIRSLLSSPHGMILLSGPTGSGKSTTLYAMIQELISPLRKIITLEDPIEYHMPQITQVLLNHKQGFDFSAALKALLRHDPDVLMLGEIRDTQSLQIALRASLTGHLLLSTLHANDALGVIERLLDMGAQGYILASSLKLVIAQRLARRLCEHCKVRVSKESVLLQMRELGLERLAWQLEERLEGEILESSEFYTAKGCAICHQLGFQGRILLYEILPISPLVQDYIKAPSQKAAFLAKLQAQGFSSMLENALTPLSMGTTSLEEIYRVCRA